MVAHGLRVRWFSNDERPVESGVPVLHSARTRRFALLLGIAVRMRGGAGEDRRRPKLQWLHLRDAKRVLHRAARHNERRMSGRDIAPSRGRYQLVEQPRRFESPVYD